MTRLVETNFYEFTQNNSGGSFVANDKLCHRIFIEAINVADAISKAEELGIYFDGTSTGRDCSCCGDRWHEPWDELNIDMMNEKGYLVSEYGSTQGTEERWRAKYGVYDIFEQPVWVKKYSSSAFEGRIVFKDIEEYVQFLTNEYGGNTTPDARIFFFDGEVKEINRNKEVSH